MQILFTYCFCHPKMPMKKCKEVQEITFAFNFHIENIVHVIGNITFVYGQITWTQCAQVYLLFKTNTRCSMQFIL
jgi:hypothetical protein